MPWAKGGTKPLSHPGCPSFNSDITNCVFKGNWVALQHPGLTVPGCDTTYSTSETPLSLPHTTNSHLNKAPAQVNSLTFTVHLTTCSADKVKLFCIFLKCMMALWHCYCNQSPWSVLKKWWSNLFLRYIYMSMCGPVYVYDMQIIILSATSKLTMDNAYVNWQYTKEYKKQKQFSCSLSSVTPAFWLNDTWFFETCIFSQCPFLLFLSYTQELRSRFQLSPHQAPSFFPHAFSLLCHLPYKHPSVQVHMGTWAALENSYNHDYWRTGDIF